MISVSFEEQPINLVVDKAVVTPLTPRHCMNCTTLLFKSTGKILLVWQGPNDPGIRIPLDAGWQEFMCRRCKQHYNVYYT